MGRPGHVVLTIWDRAVKSIKRDDSAISVNEKDDRSPEILVAVMTGTVR